MGELIAAIAEAVTTIVAGLIEITIHLLAGVFSAGYLATRRKGVERLFYVLTLFLAAYLLFGLARAFFEPLAGPVIGKFYSPVLVIIAFFALFVSILVPAAMREASASGDGRRIVILSYLLAIALFLGAFTFWGETTRVPTMEERFCASVLDRLDPDWADRLQSLAARFADTPDGAMARAQRCLTGMPPD